MNSKNRLLLIFLGISVIIATIFLFINLSTVQNLGEKSFSYDSVIEAKSFSSLNGGAFVFLALGAQTIQMNCPAAIESLVRFGGWNGEIYLITDKYACYDEKEIIENAGIEKDKFHLIKIDKDYGGGGFDFSRINVGSRKNRIKSFAEKTRLFDYVNDTAINVIAYADCDILFGLEGCPNNFIREGKEWNQEKIKFSHVRRENKTNELITIHAGTIVMHREYSKNILKIWNKEILTGLYDGDNDAYMGALHKLNRINSVHNIMEPEEISLNGKKKKINGYEKFLNIDQKKVFCMNHIPKARCFKFGRNVVQKFVDRFNLKTYKNGENYCTHPSLATLLYGWFPINWLPKCAKLETFL